MMRNYFNYSKPLKKRRANSFELFFAIESQSQSFFIQSYVNGTDAAFIAGNEFGFVAFFSTGERGKAKNNLKVYENINRGP